MPERYARRIPEPTVGRLPVYQRVLADLAARGVATVSSAELADSAGVNAAKVRKDLSHFGTYGTPGTGYDVGYLLGQVQRELGLDHERSVVIAGMGNLGHALARSQGFVAGGFRLVGLFDIDPGRVGEIVAGVEVRHVRELEDTCRGAGAQIGVVTTPAQAAQEVVDRLVSAGVGAILNFAPAVLSVPSTVQLRHVDFAAELQVLAFYHAHPDNRPEDAAGSPVAARAVALRANGAARART